MFLIVLIDVVIFLMKRNKKFRVIWNFVLVFLELFLICVLKVNIFRLLFEMFLLYCGVGEKEFGVLFRC